jgi:hypothetical protein
VRLFVREPDDFMTVAEVASGEPWTIIDSRFGQLDYAPGYQRR